MCSNAIKTGESHRGGLDLLFCVDFEQIGHMTWELLSSNAHIYSIKYITGLAKYYVAFPAIQVNLGQQQ
jgi:hypothetical protein